MIVVVENYSTDSRGDYYLIVIVVGFHSHSVCTVVHLTIMLRMTKIVMSTSILCLEGIISTRLVIITTSFKYTTGITKSFCSITFFFQNLCCSITKPFAPTCISESLCSTTCASESQCFVPHFQYYDLLLHNSSMRMPRHKQLFFTRTEI